MLDMLTTMKNIETVQNERSAQALGAFLPRHIRHAPAQRHAFAQRGQ
jgi:hypothetical protein